MESALPAPVGVRTQGGTLSAARTDTGFRHRARPRSGTHNPFGDGACFRNGARPFPQSCAPNLSLTKTPCLCRSPLLAHTVRPSMAP